MSGWTSEVDVSVGARIKAARKARGWSQARLAAECGKGVMEISTYERGVRAMNVTSLWAVARGLKRSVGWFFEDIQAQERERRGPPNPRLRADRLALGGTIQLARRRRRGGR